jgi:hypothetical protein
MTRPGKPGRRRLEISASCLRLSRCTSRQPLQVQRFVNWLSPRHFAENARRKIDVARFFQLFTNGTRHAYPIHQECGFFIQQPMMVEQEKLPMTSASCIQIIVAVYANSFVRALEEHSTNVEN